jgi:hypothetical protein
MLSLRHTQQNKPNNWQLHSPLVTLLHSGLQACLSACGAFDFAFSHILLNAVSHDLSNKQHTTVSKLCCWCCHAGCSLGSPRLQLL